MVTLLRKHDLPAHIVALINALNSEFSEIGDTVSFYLFQHIMDEVIRSTRKGYKVKLSVASQSASA